MVSERVIADRYQLRSRLGHGGMAVVWEGVDLRLGRPVAVKLLNPASVADPDTLERFDREARTAARLGHPNIVAVHDVGSDGGEPYLVMELVDGPNLARLLADGPLPLDRVRDVAGQVCAALAVAHAAGVVHRDIKPANILITPAGTVKVCDFGIARLLRGSQATLTAPATAIGTSYYMSPEQAAGGAVDARTDLYAVGCLLHAMLTGAPPFTGENPLSVMWRHQHEAPASLSAVRPDVPVELDRLVGQLLAKNPADRPTSADEVRQRLAAAGGQPAGPGGHAHAAGPTNHHPAATAVYPTSPGGPPSGPGYGAGPAHAAGPAHTAVWPGGPSGAAPGDPIRAAAAVSPPTRAMPALHHEPPPQRPTDRFRVGPAGLAAVAVGAVVVAALVVGLLMSNGSDPEASPTGTPSAGVAAPTVTAPPSPSPPAGGSVSSVRMTIDDLLQSGQLDPDVAEDLDDRLDEIARRLAQDEPDKAAEKIAEFRDKLDELREDEKISAEAYRSVGAGLDALAASVASTDTGQQSDNGDQTDTGDQTGTGKHRKKRRG